MTQKTTSRVAELERMERVLAQNAETAMGRVGDSDMKRRLSDIAERHERQAEELRQQHGDAQPAEQLKEETIALREIENARGEDGLMVALSHTEQEQAERYREAYRATDDERLRSLLRQHLAGFDEDQRVFLDQSVLLGEISDPRRSP